MDQWRTLLSSFGFNRSEKFFDEISDGVLLQKDFKLLD
jgi:hypothetical protein